MSHFISGTAHPRHIEWPQLLFRRALNCLGLRLALVEVVLYGVLHMPQRGPTAGRILKLILTADPLRARSMYNMCDFSAGLA